MPDEQRFVLPVVSVTCFSEILMHVATTLTISSKSLGSVSHLCAIPPQFNVESNGVEVRMPLFTILSGQMLVKYARRC